LKVTSQVDSHIEIVWLPKSPKISFVLNKRRRLGSQPTSQSTYTYIHSVLLFLHVSIYGNSEFFTFCLVWGVSSTLKLVHSHENRRDPAGSKRALMISLWEFKFFRFGTHQRSLTIKILYFHENLRDLSGFKWALIIGL